MLSRSRLNAFERPSMRRRMPAKNFSVSYSLDRVAMSFRPREGSAMPESLACPRQVKVLQEAKSARVADSARAENLLMGSFAEVDRGQRDSGGARRAGLRRPAGGEPNYRCPPMQRI